MLRAILKGNHKFWDEYFSHIEFAYNRVVHRITKVSHFESIYVFNPLTRWINYHFPHLLNLFIKNG